MSAIDNVVSSTQSQTEWGLEVFPLPMVTHRGGLICDIASTLNVNVQKAAASPIATALAAIDDPLVDGGSTPTPEAIDAATAALTAINDTNPKYILLATDGAPDCTNDTVASTVTSVQAAQKAGIGIFVLGLSQVSTDILALQSIAQGEVLTAVQSPAPANYFQVAMADELATALSAIAGSVTSCTLPLPQVPPNPAFVTVTEGGSAVPRDATHVSGWDFGAGDTTIQLYGSFCTNLQTASTTVTATFGCSTPSP